MFTAWQLPALKVGMLCWQKNLSSIQNPGWLGYIRDEILPSYIGIIISHYKDPY